MALSFVYPNGTTLSVQSPAYTLLTSGSTSYPVDCPIAAAWESANVSGKQGRVLILGSSDIFADDWLDKEENSQLCDVLFRYLLDHSVSFDPSLGRSDFEGRECVPDVSSLSALVKPCLQESDPLPQDYRSLLCDDLYGLHNDYVPDVIDLYERLNVPYEPLSLVEPHFECPRPPLRLATHQPRMLDPPPPALELFDLDECFTDVRVRLAQLADECSDLSNLCEYLQEAASVLDLDAKTLGGESPKHIMYYIGTQARISNSDSFPNRSRLSATISSSVTQTFSYSRLIFAP
jgi:intraflagellar transport protein 52